MNPFRERVSNIQEVHLINALMTGGSFQSDLCGPLHQTSGGHGKRNPFEQPMGNKGRAARKEVLVNESGEIGLAVSRV